MDPMSGEVSRAMRNRCIEVSLISPTTDTDENENETSEDERYSQGSTGMLSIEKLDAASHLQQFGSRSSSHANIMMSLHQKEGAIPSGLPGEMPSVRNLNECGRLSVGLLIRGWDAESSISLAHQLAYELPSREARLSPHVDTQYGCQDGLIGPVEVRQKWAFNPIHYSVVHVTQMIKMFSSASQKQPPKALVAFLTHSNTSNLGLKYQKFCPLVSQSEWVLSSMKKNVSAMSAMKLFPRFLDRSDFLDGYCSTTSNQLKFMVSYAYASICHSNFRSCIGSLENDQSAAVSNLSYSIYNEEHGCFRVNRLAQMLEERTAYDRLKFLKPDDMVTKKLSAIEMSFCLYEGSLERSTVPCAVTPALFPLFVAMDKLIYLSEASNVKQNFRSLRNDIAVSKLLSSRDRFWVYLKNTIFFPSEYGREEGWVHSSFLVHWRWFRKALDEFYSVSLDNTPQRIIDVPSSEEQLRRNLDLLIGNINQVLYDNAGDINSISGSIIKYCGHPVVPADSENWEAIEKLRLVARKCSVLTEDHVGFAIMLAGNTGAICLIDLMKNNHPCLFTDRQLKIDILGALCTAHWATTDETRGVTRSLPEISSIIKAPTHMEKQIEDGQAIFLAKVKAATIDTTIETVENQFCVEELKSVHAQACPVKETLWKNLCKYFLKSLVQFKLLS